MDRINKKLIITILVIILIVLLIFTIYLLITKPVHVEGYNSIPTKQQTMAEKTSILQSCSYYQKNSGINMKNDCNDTSNCYYLNGNCLDENIFASISNASVNCSYIPSPNSKYGYTLNCINNDITNNNYLITTIASSINPNCGKTDPNCNILLQSSNDSDINNSNIKDNLTGFTNGVMPPVPVKNIINNIILTDNNDNQLSITPTVISSNLNRSSNIPIVNSDQNTINQIQNTISDTNHNLSILTK